MDERVPFRCIYCDASLSTRLPEPGVFYFTPCLMCYRHTILLRGSDLSWTECRTCDEIVSHERQARFVHCGACKARLHVRSRRASARVRAESRLADKKRREGERDEHF